MPSSWAPGPNGLAAALTMARAGLAVDVIEGAEKLGGGCRTEELTLPGFHHDVCSAVHPLLSASPFFRETDLSGSRGAASSRHGIAFVHPLDGGHAAAVTGTVNETAAHLGVDRAAYARMFSSLVRNADGILPNFLAPLRSIPSSPVATALFGLKGLASAERLATPVPHRRGPGHHRRGRGPLHAARSTRPCQARSACCSPRWRTPWAGPWSRAAAARIVDALAAELESLDGRVITGQWVRRLA